MEANDMKAMRDALAKVKEWMAHRIATGGFEFSATFPTMLEDVVLPALAKPPRACDVMSQEDLTRVVINGFMKSLGQENQLASELVRAAISAAVKCAYDTQLVSKGEGA